MYTKDSEHNLEPIIIKNIDSVMVNFTIGIFLALLAVGWIIFWIIVASSTKTPGMAILFILLGLLVLFGAYYAFKCGAVENKGIIIDLKNDKLTFPGGGKPANSVLDQIRPSFIFQEMSQFEVPISEIESIRSDNSITTSVDKDGRVSTSRHFRVVIAGSRIGSYGIRLDSLEKHDQLKSIIIQANNMGSPILNR